MNAGRGLSLPVFISVLALALVNIATYPVRILIEWATSGWELAGDGRGEPEVEETRELQQAGLGS